MAGCGSRTFGLFDGDALTWARLFRAAPWGGQAAGARLIENRRCWPGNHGQVCSVYVSTRLCFVVDTVSSKVVGRCEDDRVTWMALWRGFRFVCKTREKRGP